jgi:hypothetical protein
MMNETTRHSGNARSACLRERRGVRDLENS